MSLFNLTKKDENDEDLKLLANWMAGVFTNQDQARQIQSYAYVSMYVIPIWKDRKDGYWFYLEQAMADQLNQPYRQRVYHLNRVNKDLMENKIYALLEPEHYVRAYEKLEVLADLLPDAIALRPGCSVILRRLNPESFAGSTLGEGCPSELRGAMYTTSQFVINARQMISWDGGYDRGGKQVWGATMGGYVFSKVSLYEV